MTTADILQMANHHYEIRRSSDRYIANLEHGGFPIELPQERIRSAVVHTSYGGIREIKIDYTDGSFETIRPVSDRRRSEPEKGSSE
jgi:hypothetical protein